MKPGRNSCHRRRGLPQACRPLAPFFLAAEALAALVDLPPVLPSLPASIRFEPGTLKKRGQVKIGIQLWKVNAETRW